MLSSELSDEASLIMFSLILLQVMEFSFDRASNYSVRTTKNSDSVFLNYYPFYMNLYIWVEARNMLGTVESEHLHQQADWFGKLMLKPTAYISIW